MFKKFEEIEHTADAAFRIFGKDFKELMINAAYTVSYLLCEDPSAISEKIEQKVVIEADDAEGLLVEWLSEFCFLAETKSMVFTRFEIEMISATQINARIYGDKVNRIKTHIKAVTYHNLEIIKTATGMTATVIFDI
jgi:SHS2 domain-containing protein